jgi:predicted ATPase/DNA-binding winged helix-turn-helix (wHTH) protein
MRFQFGSCELDLDRVELRVDGAVRAVEPQVFDVLAVLLKHRDRVVSKDELLDEVWQHRFVSESSLTSRIKSARQAIGDDGQAQRLIRTVHGRGYQFVGEVRVAEPVHAGRATPVPYPATPTIGRANDIDRALDLVRRARIVTLLGAGGIGKTRLAVEAALRWEQDEVCFVDLTKVRSPELVPDLVVQELGIHSGTATDSMQLLEEALRGRSLLLVLDNFEHVIDAAELVAAIVQWSPQLRVLATSRARLHVVGEHVFDVPPLPVEAAADHGALIADAVALFNQVATAAAPDFQLAPNLDDISAICRTVDGLPLAVELAAGHVRTLPPALLRARLSTQLGSPAGAARDLPARQQTIPATIDWSLQLLGEPERGLFAQLGVFSGPVPLEMIEQVCEVPAGATVVESLGRLLDQSMVRRVAGPAGTRRFALLELLRERARELLAEQGAAEVVAGRHARYVVARCEGIEERKWTDLSDRWIDVTTDLLGEIRAAHEWALVHGDGELAARIAASLGTFWHREGYHREGRQWVSAALDRAAEFDPLLLARLELAGGFLEWSRDQLVSRAHFDRAAAAFRALEHDRYLAYALALSAGTYISDHGHYTQAIAQCDEAIELARRVRERPLIAQALNVKGELARVQGDDDIALAAYEEGRDLAAAAGDQAHLSVFFANLAYLAEHRGDATEARRLACEGLRLCMRLGRRMMAVWSLSELAGPEHALGRPERGAVLVGAADTALQVMGVGRHPGDVPEHTRVVDGLEAALGSAEFRRWYAAGTRLSLDQAVALALAEPDEAEFPHPGAGGSAESAVSPASPAIAPG